MHLYSFILFFLIIYTAAGAADSEERIQNQDKRGSFLPSWLRKKIQNEKQKSFRMLKNEEKKSPYTPQWLIKQMQEKKGNHAFNWLLKHIQASKLKNLSLKYKETKGKRSSYIPSWLQKKIQGKRSSYIPSWLQKKIQAQKSSTTDKIRNLKKNKAKWVFFKRFLNQYISKIKQKVPAPSGGLKLAELSKISLIGKRSAEFEDFVGTSNDDGLSMFELNGKPDGDLEYYDEDSARNMEDVKADTVEDGMADTVEAEKADDVEDEMADTVEDVMADTVEDYDLMDDGNITEACANFISMVDKFLVLKEKLSTQATPLAQASIRIIDHVINKLNQEQEFCADELHLKRIF